MICKLFRNLAFINSGRLLFICCEFFLYVYEGLINCYINIEIKLLAGISFETDAKQNQIAGLIDLSKHKVARADFYSILIEEVRKVEPKRLNNYFERN